MEKLLFAILYSIFALPVHAQQSTVFKGVIYNEEYQVYIDMDFFNGHLTVPGQEIFGEMPGYIGAKRDSRKWLITNVEITDEQHAALDIINDYGSEDLTATLTFDAEQGTYTLKQEQGSIIKIVVNRKWIKLPKKLTFKREEPLSR